MQWCFTPGNYSGKRITFVKQNYYFSVVIPFIMLWPLRRFLCLLLWDRCSKFGEGPFRSPHDNAPVHRARSVKKCCFFFFSQFREEGLDWASQSPDLSPIQHLWAELQHRIRAGPYSQATASLLDPSAGPLLMFNDVFNIQCQHCKIYLFNTCTLQLLCGKGSGNNVVMKIMVSVWQLEHSRKDRGSVAYH